MAERIDIKRIERNVFHDYFQDGLSDILMGGYFLLIGLVLPVGSVAPLVVFIVLFFAPVLRGLKKRFTTPRTGYVELRQGDPQALPWFILGSFVVGLVALVAVLTGVGVISQPAEWYRWMPIFFGIWLAGLLLGLGLRVGVVRYYVVAGVALASGPICALVPMTGKTANIGLFFAVVGAVWLAGGALAFLRFLRKHPVLEGGVGDASE
jgi:hypothetical protein